MFQQTQKVFLTCKKDLKLYKKAKRKKNKPQTDKALPSGVTISVVKESILQLGFKRPSTYWGLKVDAYSSASIYKQDLEIQD